MCVCVHVEHEVSLRPSEVRVNLLSGQGHLLTPHYLLTEFPECSESTPHLLVSICRCVTLQ